MENKKTILKTLDNPMRIIFWSMEEFLIMIVPLFLGFMLANFFVLLSGIVLKIIYAKFKNKSTQRYFKHVLYWHLPTNNLKKQGIVKNLPPSHIREYLL